MKYLNSAIIAIIIFSGILTAADKTENITQISTLQALLESCYEGIMPIGELKKNGSFGLGTFNNLDGELVMLEGKVYKVKSTGQVIEVDDCETTPFANVTFPSPKAQVKGTIKSADKIDTFQKLKNLILSKIKNPNLPHAIKIAVKMNKITTRSVPAQKRPYPRLVEVVKNQSIFEKKNISGWIVGFYFPKYFQGVNAVGLHLHFLSNDKTFGGHILKTDVQSGEYSLFRKNGFEMILPQEGDFANAQLSRKSHSNEINKVEK